MYGDEGLQSGSALRINKQTSDALVPSSVLVTTSKALVTRSDALVPSSVLVTTSKALVTRSDALVTSSVLVTTSKALVTRSDALVTSSVLVTSMFVVKAYLHFLRYFFCHGTPAKMCPSRSDFPDKSSD